MVNNQQYQNTVNNVSNTQEENKMDTSLLEAQAYTNALSRLNFPAPGYGYGYGYGAFGGCPGGGITTDLTGRAVIASKIDAGFDSVKTTQALQLDAIVQQAAADRSVAAEFRNMGQFNDLNAGLLTQFNQVDRRFSDVLAHQQECCCDLKAGQATIIAKIEAQDAVKAAEDRVRADAKLDVLLAKM